MAYSRRNRNRRSQYSGRRMRSSSRNGGRASRSRGSSYGRDIRLVIEHTASQPAVTAGDLLAGNVMAMRPTTKSQF